MIAEELWYPFIPPSKGCVFVYPLYLFSTWIIDLLWDYSVYVSTYKTKYQMFNCRWIRKVIRTIRND